MRQQSWRMAVALALTVLLGAAPVLAADDKTKMPTVSGGSSYGTSTSGAAGTSDMKASSRHTMEGEVTKVDTKKGKLNLKTSEGTLELHFPPTALSTVKKGDRVTVEMSIENVMPSASPKMTEKLKDKLKGDSK